VTGAALLVPIALPAAGAALCALLGGRRARVSAAVVVAATAATATWAAMLFIRPQGPFRLDLGAFDLALGLRLDRLAALALLAAGGLASLVSLYAARFMAGRREASAFFAWSLLTLALVDGAILADHLLTLLFFWEGLLVPLYAMIALGGAGAFRTATKAFAINGVTDLCLIAGTGLFCLCSGTLAIAGVHLRTEGLGAVAFLLMAAGAISKAGSMPFHGWIPDAAGDAPAPFMALVPGALEKLLGIYLLARLCLQLFAPGGWPAALLMSLGAATIVLAALLALVQKDYQRLLSFHAVSQVGYMVLGIATGTAPGVVGGLFHAVNNALYKSTLFLTGGAVAQQAGGTGLASIGGLGRRMPITFACFAVAALSICGVYPFNGFFSKELVYEGALARGAGYYAAAAAGSFLTAASFLKLGHAAFGSRFQAPRPEAREAPWAMLLAMAGLSALCVLFGNGSARLVAELGSAVQASALPHERPGVPAALLFCATVLVQAAALGSHWLGFRRSGAARTAADHLHSAPVLRMLYRVLERPGVDAYRLGLGALRTLALVGNAVDRAIDACLGRLVPRLATGLSMAVRRAQEGGHPRYLAWSLLGTAALFAWLLGRGI